MDQVKCSHCKNMFPRDQCRLYKRRVNSSGTHEYYYCIPHQRELAPAGAHRFYNRHKDDPVYKATGRRSRRLSEEKYPEKRNARRFLQTGIRLGFIIRPTVCDYGRNPGTLIEGHHDDYSKPLEVRWLCRDHHGLAHHPIPQVALVELKKEPAAEEQSEL